MSAFTEVQPVLLPSGMQVSIHKCPKPIVAELEATLPAHRAALDGVRIVATAQRASHDLVRIGPEIEVEKDMLLENVCIA